MKFKNITYQRVLNLGNYENKKLEVHAELDDGDDVNQAISDLKEITESNISKEILTDFEAQIKYQQKEQARLIMNNGDLRKELRELKAQIEEYKSKLPESDDLNDDDDVPFDQGSKTSDEDPDPLSSFGEVSDPSKKNEYKRDWNQKIPEFKGWR
ncbi:hypothetical protein [Moorena sp. SIO3H5]|uniref:hypothetical protein n=1 Tax=Moorena sp. SIO3H5 TaxID=2607834 RepID=UPI0013B667F8|nr:hypothetical protein [Moorena sp. SIO3H5]NEO74601.1 hypothetical protein [Moorena sp. SIO3H5]